MPKTATLNLNGIIMPDDWIWFDESGISLPIVQKLVDAAGEFDDLTVFINSEGGVIEEGWAIYDYLLSLGKPITTIGLGAVYSMATILHSLGTTRLLSAHTKYMIHLPGGGVFGNRIDMQEYLDDLVAEEARLVEIYASTTTKDESEIAQVLADGKDHYYTAQEALDFGFITGIYQTITEPTAHRKRQPILAHASQGRKGLNLPEHKAPIIDMAKAKTRLSAALDAVKAFMEGKPLTNMVVDTQDGKKLDIETTGDAYVVGDSVKYDDGSDVPDGDIILSDGNTITVAAGVITAITEPSADEKDPSDPPATASADAENVTIPKAEFDRLKALDTEVTALKAKQEESEKFQARVTPVMKAMEAALGKMESADPIVAKQTETPIDKRVPEEKPKDDAISRKNARLASRNT